jgi:hypothetical protein
MLRSTASYLIFLGFCMGATCEILRASTPNILCLPLGAYAATSRPRYTIKDCYKAVRLIENNVAQVKTGLFYDIRNREVGKRLTTEKALGRFTFLTVPGFFLSDRCYIDVYPLSSTGGAGTQKMPTPSTPLDTMRYFYLWERIADTLKQLLGHCFEEENREGMATSHIDGDNWHFHYGLRVADHHHTGPDSYSSDEEDSEKDSVGSYYIGREVDWQRDRG